MPRRDDLAFVEFVAASQQRLRRSAYLMTGDWQTAADLTQEALIRVYVAWPRIERGGGLPTYARRALVSAYIDHQRKRDTRTRHEERAAPSEEVVDPAEAATDRKALLDALRVLPPRQRACVVLRYFDDLSVADCASALGCSQGTVKSQTARGLETLRRGLGGLSLAGEVPIPTEETRR